MTTPAPLRLGTRRSQLATAQSERVADALRARGHEVELVAISTLGDTSTHQLTTIGGTGVFAAAIRGRLLDRTVDLAVHSLKDLPVAPEPGLVVAAVPARDDPRDVLVARDGLTLGELPHASTIGTGSPRREAQLRALGLGLDVTPVRGNVGTRIGFVHSGSLDAVVLARAGLARLGLLGEVTETLDPLQMLPAPGQGALAVECRADRPDLVAALAELDDPDSRTCVTAERALLAGLEAGCTAPVGSLAEIVEGQDGPELWLRAVVGARDGSHLLRRSIVASALDPRGAGRRLADLLLEDGAADLDVDEPPGRPPAHPPDGRPRQPSLVPAPHRTPSDTEQVS